MEYPAISLHQPYASLIAIGAKPFETRGRRPPLKHIGKRAGNTHGGQFLISIALRMPSLSRLKQIDTAKIMAPGKAATPGLT